MIMSTKGAKCVAASPPKDLPYAPMRPSSPSSPLQKLTTASASSFIFTGLGVPVRLQIPHLRLMVLLRP